MTRLTNEEVLKLLGTDSLFNKTRKLFNAHSAKIGQTNQQEDLPSLIRIRAMEFDAVIAILSEAIGARRTNYLLREDLLKK